MSRHILLAATALIFAALSGQANADPRKVASLSAGHESLPPIGWVEFCERHRDDCDNRRTQAESMALDEKRWKELVRANTAINAEVEPVTDQEQWGKPEQWDYPATGKGDCEDYVLEKRKRLMKLGWPRSALLITVVRDKKGDGHAVLTARTDRGDFILDNQVNKILLWTDTGYLFVKRQAPENQNRWLSLGNVDTKPFTAAR